jgi:hypothetical protein
MRTKFWLGNLQRLLRRLRRRWEDSTRMDVREIGWEGVDWIYVA